jgi:phenylalanyl-tRNA synthetase alpha chain
VFLHNYEIKVLRLLVRTGSASLTELEKHTELSRDQVLWALHGLEDKGFVKLHYKEERRIILTAEGKKYAESGLPESRLLQRISKSEVKTASLSSNEDKIGLQWLMRKRLAQVDNGALKITSTGESALKKEFPEERLLRAIGKDDHGKLASEHREELDTLKRRGLLDIENVTEFEKAEITQKGKEASKNSSENTDEIGSIDREMIAKMGWKGRKFSEYDVSAKVDREFAAKRHVLKQTIDRIKDVYMSMGFKEISGPTIDSAFWVFDSLFVPQDHPARDKQDTFFLENPKDMEIEEKDYAKRIKEEHERSWKYDWDIDKARQSVLRTHTTSVSARFVQEAVAKIVSEESDEALPLKAFSLGRLFRNENIDYRHLADFYQHDGVIIGKDLTMANLFDTLIKIYAKLGIKIKFKPSYFPFVEPAAEFYGYSDVTDEWVELGGSGIMRSEVTGIARSKISVLAWGAGVERVLLMSKDNGIKSIAELYNNGIGFARNMRSV